MTRLAMAAAAALAGGALAVAAGNPDPPGTTTETTETLAAPVLVVASTYQGHDAAWWAARSRGWHHRTRALRRTLLHQPGVVEALDLACTAYGGCQTLWRRARCESTLNPDARHSGAPDSPRGLLQFKPSTWRTTPYAGFSIYSPYANALAAGWANAHGRGGEWACQ